MNLSDPGTLAQLSRQLKTEIDTYCSDKYDEGPRGHLGASSIGNSCSRALWYAFRWISHKKHDGRQQRLFQRGHFEEPRFVSYLEGIGFTVQMFDDANLAEADKGKRQIRISACKGHFGGSIDGIGTHPVYGKFLTEFKTQGTGKGFTELCKSGVKLKKPVHFAQMSMYGYKLGLKYTIYMAVNKNDDDLHVEVVELDWKLGRDLERKAEMIIFADEPPAKISMSPAYYECAWCDCLKICHEQGDSLVNCRSCRMSKPVDNAEWFCEQYNNQIPKEYIINGCPEWKGLVV